MAEVMATALTERLLTDKERDLGKQDLLVQALRDLANILEIRGVEKTEKLKLSANANKELAKQRNLLAKLQKDAGDMDAAKATRSCRADDEVQAGRVCSLMTKRSKAMKHFAKANRLRSHHLEACTEALSTEHRLRGNLAKAGKHGQNLAEAISQAGIVNRSGESFQLQPEAQRPADVPALVEKVRLWCDSANGMPEPARGNLARIVEDISAQVERIQSGEQAANAALASAVDKLNPTVDYHEFSRF